MAFRIHIFLAFNGAKGIGTEFPKRLKKMQSMNKSAKPLFPAVQIYSTLCVFEYSKYPAGSMGL